MTSVAQLVATTRRHLYGTYRPEHNFLEGAIDADDTTLTFELDLRGIQAGAVLSIDDELIFVKAQSSVPNKQVTVKRGWLDTTPAAHADEAIVEVNSRFPAVMVKAALKEEIASWPDGLYRIPTPLVLTGSTTSRAYNLTGLTNVIDVIQVERENYTTETGGTWKPVKYRFDRHANTTDFASGYAIFLDEALTSAANIQVTYTAPFVTSTFADATDVETTVGLAGSMVDIPPLGAAWRLVAPREVKRTFAEAQGESRNAEEVPPGFSMQTASNLMRLRDKRIQEEIERLARKRTWRW